MQAPLFKENRSGFTFIEIMISMSIMLTVSAMSLNFLVETGRLNFTSAEKNDINRELRNIVDRLATEAKQSNLFVIYESAEDSDRVNIADRVKTGGSGDAILLVFKSAYADMDALGVDPLRDPRPITRLILYYRSTISTENGVGRGPVRRWERDYSNNPVTDTASIHNLETLLPTLATLDSESIEVVALSEGLADGRLFYNYQSRTAMVNGKIIHGNNAKWVTDTYNFSISPRG